MYCHACGRKLPDDAKFCVECGTPQAEVDSRESATPETLWESCLIAHGSGKWHAPVTTPRGSYSIVEPRRRSIFYKQGSPNGANNTTIEAHRALVQRLAREGWEPLGGGPLWWQREFRRPATPREWEYADVALTYDYPSRLIADAIGEDGQYIALESVRLKGFRDATARASALALLPNFVTALERDGWELVGSYGAQPWEQRWRRHQKRPI